jgi:hypothetical protein
VGGWAQSTNLNDRAYVPLYGCSQGFFLQRGGDAAIVLVSRRGLGLSDILAGVFLLLFPEADKAVFAETPPAPRPGGARRCSAPIISTVSLKWR